MPYSLFNYNCEHYEKHFEDRGIKDATGKKRYGIRILALGTLRMLGRDIVFDDLEDLNGISSETNRVFFHGFVGSLSARAKEFIKLPETEEELKHVSGLYEKLGLPGCAGSADCVHLFWDRCPANLVSQCRGKEKYPSVVFQVIAAHTKKIMSVSQIHMGCDNDRTIARYDAAMTRIRALNDVLKTSKFLYYKSDGTVAEAFGYYYIVDGGYSMWVELMAPFKHEPEGTVGELWSDTLESIRKDIECVFGILKQRFLILKHPMRFPEKATINKIFLACCVLHNQLCDYDGRDNWESCMEMGEFEDIESDVEGDGKEYRERTLNRGRRKKPLERVGLTRHMRRQLAVHNAKDARALPAEDEEDRDETVSISAKEDYTRRRDLLVNHFKVATRKGEVVWI